MNNLDFHLNFNDLKRYYEYINIRFTHFIKLRKN